MSQTQESRPLAQGERLTEGDATNVTDQDTPVNGAVTDSVNSRISPADRAELIERHAVSAELIDTLIAENRLISWGRGQALKWVSPDGLSAPVKRVREADRRDGEIKVIWPGGQTLHVNAVRYTEAENVILAEGFCQQLAAASWAPEGFDVVGMNGCDGVTRKVSQTWAKGKHIWLSLDADRSTNDRVRAAVDRVTAVLTAEGARSVRLIDNGGTETDGLDDVLNDVRPERRTAALRRMTERAQVIADTEAVNVGLVDGLSFLSPDAPDEPPLWGHADMAALWSSGESLFIVGPPGAGKSTLAHLVVFGRLGLLPDVFGFPVEDDGRKVLYLAMDRPKQIQRAMRRLVRPEHGEVLSERLLFHRGPLPVSMTSSDEHRDYLRDLALAHGVGTIVVDSLKDVLPDASDEKAAGRYNSARQSALAAGVEWIELHHNRKAGVGNKAPNTLEDVYGSRWLTAGAGSVIALWQDEPGSPLISLTHLRASGEKWRDTTLVLDAEAGTLSTRHDESLEDFMARHPKGFTVAQAASALHNGKAKPGQVEAVRGKIKRLEGRGVLELCSGEGGDDPFDARGTLRRYRLKAGA